MRHLIISLHIINLFIGLIVLSYVMQRHRMNRSPLLRRLMQFILLFNVFVLIDFISKYIYTNILEFDYNPWLKVSWGMVIRHPLSFIIGAGMVYSFMGLALLIQDKTLPRLLQRLFFSGVLLILMCYAVGITLYIHSTSYTLFRFSDQLSTRIGIALIYGILFFLFWKSKNLKDAQQKKAVRVFGILYLFGFSLPIAVFVFRIVGGWAIIAFCLILINGIPFIWLKYFWSFYEKKGFPLVEDQTALNKMFKEYSISRREQDIIAHILQGKSNKEIENQLFISRNTVRNHLYSIYQKFGVKSRGQLVHFIQEAQKGS